jgi:hypothetical protein
VFTKSTPKVVEQQGPTTVVPVPEVLVKVPELVIRGAGSASTEPEQKPFGQIPELCSEFALKVPALLICEP